MEKQIGDKVKMRFYEENWRRGSVYIYVCTFVCLCVSVCAYVRVYMLECVNMSLCMYYYILGMHTVTIYFKPVSSSNSICALFIFILKN